jgi:tetratricopeptide (TPR) repeat protein
MMACWPFQAEALLNKALIIKEKDPQAAYELLNKLLDAPQNKTSLSVEDRFKIVSTLSEVALNANHSPQALVAYSQLAELERTYPLVVRLTVAQWAIKGYLHQEAKQWELARVAYDAVLKENPEDGESYYNKGLTYFKQANYPEAIVAFERALSVNSPAVEARYSLGLIAEKQQRWNEALVQYRLLMKVGSEQNTALVAMGITPPALEKRIKTVEAKLVIKPAGVKIAVPAIAMPSVRKNHQ